MTPTPKEPNCNSCKDTGPGCLWCGRGKPEAVPTPAQNDLEAWDQIMERLDDWDMKREAKAIFLTYCDEKRRAALEGDVEIYRSALKVIKDGSCDCNEYSEDMSIHDVSCHKRMAHYALTPKEQS